MADESGRKSSSLIAELCQEGEQFEFFQAVRLLERFRSFRSPIGLDSSPDREVLRIRVLNSLNFPTSQIADFALGGGDNESSLQQIPLMTVTFMGLVGPQGILPQHYTSLAIERSRQNPEDLGLKNFLDLFHHRSISLFYRAWAKYLLPLHIEQKANPVDREDSESPESNKVKGTEEDLFSLCLTSLVGLAGRAVATRLDLDRETIVYYSGHFSHFPRCAIGLELLLSDFFGLNIKIEQFSGQWLNLERDYQSRLPQPGELRGRNGQLGNSAIVGTRFWSEQSKFRIRIESVGRKEFYQFIPTSRGMAQLTDMVRLYCGDQLDFDVQVILRRDEVVGTHLSSEESKCNRLGWDCWLVGREFPRDADDAIFRPVQET